MSDMTKDESDLMMAELQTMAREAERTGKWFHCNYQDLWFSPREIRTLWDKGQFRWGPVNWKLLFPSTKRADLERDIVDAELRLREFDKRCPAVQSPVTPQEPEKGTQGQP